MAVQETNPDDATPRIACALPLVDFDWKLKYAVASAMIAAVNKPLVRLELYVSKASSKVEDVGLGTTVYPENQIQPVVAEFSKAQLDALLRTMDAIEQDILEFHFGEGLSRDLGTLVIRTLLITFEILALSPLVTVILILKGKTWGDGLLEEHCSKL